jgi:hypothetical protein
LKKRINNAAKIEDEKGPTPIGSLNLYIAYLSGFQRGEGGVIYGGFVTSYL